jgi:DedD protein
MNDDHNELNDIILNRNEKSDSRKKMLIGIGTLTVVAIVIVIVMGRMSGSTPTQLPKPALPSEHATASSDMIAAPAEETAAVSSIDRQLEAVAQNVKAEPIRKPVPIEQSEVVIIDERHETTTTKETAVSEPAAEPVHSKMSKQAPPATSMPMQTHRSANAVPAAGDIYVQVGSFSRYKPNQKFLDGITRAGYDYTLHRVTASGKIVNKVLVGPFSDRNDARAHLSDIRRKIEAGAYIYTIKP